MIAGADALRGGVAVVTGGAGTGAGLGRGLVKALSERGMQVAVLDIDVNAAEQVADDITRNGGRAIACRIDIADPATLVNAAEAVRSAFGACNILCAHAVAGINPLADDLWAPDEWRAAMNGIVIGTVATVHAFLPLMRDSPGPRRVVFTASSVALGPGKFQGPYRAAKVAVVSMAETLALELANEGITTTVAFPNGMAASPPEDNGRSGADRAHDALADALAGLDLPPHILARFAAIGEEMATDSSDLASGDAVAATVVDAVVQERPYVITHGRSTDRNYRARTELIEAAFADLAARGYLPIPARSERPDLPATVG